MKEKHDRIWNQAYIFNKRNFLLYSQNVLKYRTRKWCSFPKYSWKLHFCKFILKFILVVRSKFSQFHIFLNFQHNGLIIFTFRQLIFDISAFDDKHQHVLLPTSLITGTTHIFVDKIRDHVLTYTKRIPNNADSCESTTIRPTMIDFISKIKKTTSR